MVHAGTINHMNIPLQSTDLLKTGGYSVFFLISLTTLLISCFDHVGKGVPRMPQNSHDVMYLSRRYF